MWILRRHFAVLLTLQRWFCDSAPKTRANGLKINDL